MNKRAIITVVTRNYGHYALALAESVSRHQPDCDFLVCFADRPSEMSQPALQNLHSICAESLDIPDWKRFAFQYTPFELSCALKPAAIKYAIDQGYDDVVYLDADMRLLGPLEEVWSALQNDSIVLTPHLIRPFPNDGQRPGEDLFLMAGTFNAGFLAIRNSNVAAAFLNWWTDRLAYQCYKDLAASIFVDQKWLSLVPGLFDEVHILRNPGYNTGHWTLPQFPLSRDASGNACIGTESIVLFHFSNFSPDAPHEFENCQERILLSDEPILQGLVADYHASINRFAEFRVHNPNCEYDCLRDGTKIHPAWREAVRRRHPILESVLNPFDSSDSMLLAKLRSLEGKARKWRRDWRLKGASQVAAPKSKKLKVKIKNWLAAVGLRKKKAA
jgi:hypothetical protein